MFLKEVIYAFYFAAGLFTISGFAIKIDKFENNNIFKNSENNKSQMFLPLDSFYKLKIKSGENFKYFLKNEKHVKKISQIETLGNHATLIFDEPQISYNDNSTITPIKYYLESKPFWVNLFK